jgi:hypothetical protein
VFLERVSREAFRDSYFRLRRHNHMMELTGHDRSFILLPDAPTYLIPAYPSSTSCVLWALLAGPIAGVVSVGSVNGLSYRYHRGADHRTAPYLRRSPDRRGARSTPEATRPASPIGLLLINRVVCSAPPSLFAGTQPPDTGLERSQILAALLDFGAAGHQEGPRESEPS